MEIEQDFYKIPLDTTRIEYINFKEAMLSIDWRRSIHIRPYNAVLDYAPGIVFANVPFMNDNPQHIKKFGKPLPALQSEEFTKLWETSIPFFSFIEELFPNHRVIKGQVMATQPEVYHPVKMLGRMHIDNGVFHTLSKRCQIGFLTNEGSFLMVDGNSMLIEEGTVYHFNNQKPHWGINTGKTLKLCIVLDLIDLDVWNNLTSEQLAKFYSFPVKHEDLQRLVDFKHKWIKDNNLKL